MEKKEIFSSIFADYMNTPRGDTKLDEACQALLWKDVTAQVPVLPHIAVAGGLSYSEEGNSDAGKTQLVPGMAGTKNRPAS